MKQLEHNQEDLAFVIGVLLLGIPHILGFLFDAVKV